MYDTLGCLLVEAAEATVAELRAEVRGDRKLSSRTRTSREFTETVDAAPENVDADAWSARPLARRPLGGKPLIDWVLRRASEAEQLQGIVVVLPANAGLDSFKAALPSGVMVFESRQPDRLGRIAECLEAFPTQGVINLRLDCPLLDPCLVDRLVCSAGSASGVDYATYQSSERPARNRLQAILRAQLGLFAEYIRADVLRQLHVTLKRHAARQDFTAYLCAHPEKYLLRLVSLPHELDRDDLRLSLRHRDDWDHAEQIIEALGDEDLDWQRIVSLLQRQPWLRQRMADLNQADRLQQTR